MPVRAVVGSSRRAVPPLAALVLSIALACSDTTEPCTLGGGIVDGIGTSQTPVECPKNSPAGPVAPQITTISGLAGRPFGVAVSPNGTIYVTQQDVNSVARLSLTTSGVAGAPILVSEDPGDVIFNRAGTVAYVSTFYGNKVHVIDVATGNQTAVVSFPQNAYRLALSADESKLFVTSVTGRLSSFPTTSPSTLPTSVLLGGSLQGIALSPSGTSLYVTSTDGRIVRLDPATLATVASGTVSGRLQDVAVSPDGAELYVADELGAVLVVDAATLTTKASVAVAAGAFGLELTPDGKRIYVASTSGQLTVIDRVTRAIVAQVTLGGLPRRIAFDAAGTTAVIANESNWVNLVR